MIIKHNKYYIYQLKLPTIIFLERKKNKVFPDKSQVINS
jgi:hypothetical protein